MNKPKNIKQRSPKYIGALPMVDIEFIQSYVAELKHMYGIRSVFVRGRHSNRKAVLTNEYRVGAQNDIPWRKAEWVAFYKR
jgi:hypothetical protein